MSSTNRGAERVALDAYYTPDAVARACVATIAADVRGTRCWEPHAGGGAFVRALNAAGAVAYYSDINPDAPAYNAPDLVNGVGGGHPIPLPIPPCDAREGWTAGALIRPHWIVGNPPFNDAEAHVRMALDIAAVGVAFLLRLAFLESTKRLPFWRENPPAEVYVLSRRPSFTGGGTDSAAYGWFVWRRGNTDEPVLRWLDWSAS